MRVWHTQGRSLLTCKTSIRGIRSSYSRIFFKIGSPKTFGIFNRKHVGWILSLIKLQAWKSPTLLKRDPNTALNIAKFLRTTRRFYKTPQMATSEAYSEP